MTTFEEPNKAGNFLRQIIESDLAAGTHAGRYWGGSPGDAKHHAQGVVDTNKIRTRFPPEPNGYLHIGHAKSICLNFGLALDYDGVCHLRFDDTNPEKEEAEYVTAIKEAVRWLGFNWNGAKPDEPSPPAYHASDYFDFMYRSAEYLIEQGLAYVDEQTPDEMKANRGDFNTAGTDSPYRNRSVAENMERFREMRAGKHADGSMVLRAKIDMASPNLNMRDPAIYRIKHASHHNTGDTWCIYPMYTYAHPIEDALEAITHSICTLEFEDQRPFYDWVTEKLSVGGLITQPIPHQYEFARLNLTHVVTSKRKLKQLVDDGHVSGWDDPRLPTIMGLRRRGYTPNSLRTFSERIGVAKVNSWIDYHTLEGCLREDLENTAPRAMAVLDPVKLVLTNWAEVFGSDDYTEDCQLPALPPSAGATDAPKRNFKISNTVWIERADFQENPPKGYKRLFVGNVVRLKGGYVIECTGCTKDEHGMIIEVHATVFPNTKSGTAGADSVKAKAAITWVATVDAIPATVHVFEHLFTDEHPDSGNKNFLALINPNSMHTVQAWLEPSVGNAAPETHYQFERLGYFVTDQHTHSAQAPVFNRITGLRDGFKK